MRPLLHRFGFVVVTLAALVFAAWLGGPPDPIERAAKRLQAERWYAVHLHGSAIGHFHTRGRRSQAGHRFDSELVFRLGTAPQTHIVESYVFDAKAPYPLVAAEHAYVTGDDSTHVGIERRTEGLVARVNGETTALDWDYLLKDYLAVATWLDRDPAIGAALSSRSVDFDGLSPRRESWRVVGRNATGYRLRNRAASTIQLDADHAPVHFRIADVFDMTLAESSRSARVWQRARPAAHTYDVAIDKPIDSPQELTRLLLRVRAENTADLSWWPLLRRDAVGDPVLDSRRGAGARAHPKQLKTLSRATATHPATDTKIRLLAKRAASGPTDPTRQIEALVHFVHGYIDYAEEESPRTVANILRERRGDCTEYANLLTTLARALGFAARTVTGLAYDVDAKSFTLHNWSEVALDGQWIPVDPTWDQMPADAGHLRLPDKPGLAVFGLLSKIEFELLHAEYGAFKR